MVKKGNQCDFCRHCSNIKKVPADLSYEDGYRPYAFDKKFFCTYQQAPMYMLPQTIFKCSHFESKRIG